MTASRSFVRRCAAAACTLVVLSIPIGAQSLAPGTVLTVGPDGNYSSIQSAIDVAINPATNYLIRIQAGYTFSENLVVDLLSGGYLDISGGWSASFSTRPDDPTLTIVDGGGASHVLIAEIAAGATFSLRNLTLQNGLALGWGGGAVVFAEDATLVRVENNLFTGNHVEATERDLGIGPPIPYPGRGGGLFVGLSSTSGVVSGNRFIGNSARVTGDVASDSALGGGFAAGIAGSSVLQVSDNLVDGCSCWAHTMEGSARGCGMYLSASDTASLELSANWVTNSAAIGFDYVRGVAGSVFCSGDATVVAQRNLWRDATLSGSAAVDWMILDLVIEDSCELTQRSSLMSGSDLHGLSVLNRSTALYQGVNLTVAGNAGNGVMVEDWNGSATQRLSNSLVFGNSGSDISLGTGAVLEQSYNHLGSDPGCVDATRGLYQLDADSSALNAGTNTPPGGLSSFDLGGVDRISEGVVDIGAYEGLGDIIFFDGFEEGNTDSW